MNHPTTAHAGAEDHTKNRRAAFRDAIGRFRQCQTVGVVTQSYGPLQQGLQIGLQRLSIQASGIGIANAAATGIGRTGVPHANRAARFVKHAFGAFDQCTDCLQGRRIIALRCRAALAEAKVAGRIENRGFDLGAAEIDTDVHLSS